MGPAPANSTLASPFPTGFVHTPIPAKINAAVDWPVARLEWTGADFVIRGLAFAFIVMFVVLVSPEGAYKVDTHDEHSLKDKPISHYVLLPILLSYLFAFLVTQAIEEYVDVITKAMNLVDHSVPKISALYSRLLSPIGTGMRAMMLWHAARVYAKLISTSIKDDNSVKGNDYHLMGDDREVKSDSGHVQEV